MTLYEEIYFDITLTGKKADLERFISFLNGGGLDDFFEMDDSYIDYDDSYKSTSDEGETYITFSNDDIGIEVDEFDVDEFLEILCKAGKRLYIKGQLYDADNEEYSFVSEAGDSYYTNALLVRNFNEDEDKPVEETKIETVLVIDVRLATVAGETVVYLNVNHRDGDGAIYKRLLSEDESMMLITPDQYLEITYTETNHDAIREIKGWKVVDIANG